MSEFGSIEDRPKRFYKDVGIKQAENGWSITLDERPIRTPSKNILAAPNRGLAQLIASEWASQGEFLDIASMHTTRLANVAFDRTPNARDDMAEEAVRYAQTDLVCHLADAPAELVDRQEKAWSSLRDWAGEELGALLIPAKGIKAARQPDASLEAIRRYALELDDWSLTGLNFGLGLLGSVVLSAALQKGRIDADTAFAACRIDDEFQAEKWGRDDEADSNAARRLVEVLALGAWFAATGS